MFEFVCGIDDADDDEFVTADYKSLRDADGCQRRSPLGGSSESRPKHVAMMSTPTTIILIISSTSSFLHTSATPTPTSGIPVCTESGETPPPADDGRRAEIQSYHKSSLDMSEVELVALEDRVRTVGRTGSSPCTTCSPFAPANAYISYTASSMSLSRYLSFDSYS